MTYLRRTPIKGTGRAVYTGTNVPTKSSLLKDALGIAIGDKVHSAFIDFIPARFSLQLHGWFDRDPNTGYTSLSQVKAHIDSLLKSGEDPITRLRGKWHYDLRIRKRTAVTWFGLTLFRAPWTGTNDNKVKGTVKGYQQIAPGAAKLQKFLLKEADRAAASEGIAERRDRVEWMRIKAQWFPFDSPGNPQKNQDAAMISIEMDKPAVIHRRELDFVDVTFFGDHLKGRYYDRLVEQVTPEDLKTKAQQASKKPTKSLSFFFWKAKDQWGSKVSTSSYPEADVKAVAMKKKILKPLPIPGKAPASAFAKPPVASEAFH